jgi:hypothetical protein
MREDRLRDGHIVRAIEARTDRFDVAENRRGNNWQFWRRVEGEDSAARDRAAHKAQDARALRGIDVVAAAPPQQNRVLVARQRAPDPPHHADAWFSARPTIARTRSRRYAAVA